jgi:ATP-binding cassette subfamily F protein uup
MVLASLRHISLAFGGPPLLSEASLQINKGERICLLGRNGSGKSTLLRLLAGELPPDSGIVDRRQGLRVASLPQDVPANLHGSIFAIIARAFGTTGEQLSRYRELSDKADHGEQGLQHEMAGIHHRLDESDGWKLQQRIELVMSHLDLSGETEVSTLSGGMARRVLLARALAAEPDILLLDEPTNHLDIASINWLEQFLLRMNLTLVFVTHDRSFLRALANRIIELDRGRLFDFSCDYDTFLLRKEDLLHNESQEWRRFDKKLAEEETWIRKGIKARRTRNEGRVRALKKMREERRERRERQGMARLGLSEAERSGKLVAQLEGVSFGYGLNRLIDRFSTTVMRGDRIGIIGPNGAGKTTLLKLLLGKLAPQQGSVRLGTNLQILYFDQLREQLDPDKTVQQNLAGDQDTIVIGGQSRHVIGYLQDFLFTPDRARSPVRILSGGERNRLLLARLFTRPANVLVLDEPTNDLDLETLDLLEEQLAEFKGTIFLVSHDRDFLNRVVTSTIAFERDGRVAEYIGGYDDWLRQRPPTAGPAAGPAAPPKEKPARQRPRKMSFKERQEFEALPQRIDALENEQAELHQRMADPSFYRESGDQVATAKARLAALENELEQAYVRWGALEELSGG